MLQEEQAIDELLDPAKPGSVDDTIKVFPDETRLDQNKTSGRKHRALLKAIITRFKAWVLALVTPLQSDIAAINEILNMPPPPPQDVKWKAEPTVVIEDGKAKVGAGLALWKGQELSYLPQELMLDALLDNTKIRLDMIYATEDRQYRLLKGDEGSEVTRKALPEGALWVRDVIVKGDGATTDTPATINFNYATYTEKAVPADTAVFLVQEASGTKYKWSLSQLITWLSSKGIGGTIESTDDILQEGATNKWFTDARVYLAKATNYVIQGTTRAITQNDTLGMILGIFENRLNVNTTAIEDRELKATRESIYAVLPLSGTVAWSVGTGVKEGKRTLTIPNGWSGTSINFSVSNISAGFTGILAIYNNDAVSHALRFPQGSNYAMAEGETSSINVPAGGIMEINIAFDGVKIKIIKGSFSAI